MIGLIQREKRLRAVLEHKQKRGESQANCSQQAKLDLMEKLLRHQSLMMKRMSSKLIVQNTVIGKMDTRVQQLVPIPSNQTQ